MYFIFSENHYFTKPIVKIVHTRIYKLRQIQRIQTVY